MRRIGVIGGSFDPIHYGHLALAEAARCTLALDEVRFVPTAQQPLKSGHAAPASARLALTKAAIADNPAFTLSSLELERAGPSFTVDTLTTFKAAEPAAQWWFILGSDALASLERWHAWQRLLTLARLAVAERPGSPLAAVTPPPAAPVVDHVDAPALVISSSELRARVAAGRSVRYLLPDPVANLIADLGLYRPSSR